MKLYNNNGAVSAYGLACGYVQTYSQETGKAELYHEGGVYHVRIMLDVATGQLWGESEAWQWLSFESLQDARNKYKEFCAIVGTVYTKNWPWCTAYAHRP